PLNGTGAPSDYEGITSEQGSGNVTVYGQVTDFDPAFFPAPPRVIETQLFGGLGTPFNAVVPTRAFTDPSTGATYLPAIGSNNGTSGPDLLFQTGGAGQRFDTLGNGRLSGTVYDDANNDGRPEPGEPGVGAVSVTLTGRLDQGGTITETTRTAP